jgi:Fe-Mn family superoxide dismutase
MLGMTGLAGADDHGHDGHSGPPMPKKLMSVLQSMHDGNEYTLPPLPYAYDAVDAAIDEQTMRLHHDKHHAGYVKNLNEVVKEYANDKYVDGHHVYGLDRGLSFNYGGHVLHSIFWATMGPDENGTMGGEPRGKLAEAMMQSFGSLDGFRTTWSKTAASVKGSGWVQMVFDPVAVSLRIVGVNDHDKGFLPGTFPLLPLDVWEHAYYLRFQNKRAEYVDAFFKVIDWSTVDALYAMVSAPYEKGR